MVLLKANTDVFRLGSVLKTKDGVAVYTDTHLPARTYDLRYVSNAAQVQSGILKFYIDLFGDLRKKRFTSEVIKDISAFEESLQGRCAVQIIPHKRSTRPRKKDEPMFVVSEDHELYSLDHYYMYLERGKVNYGNPLRIISYTLDGQIPWDKFVRTFIRNKQDHGDIVCMALRNISLYAKDICGAKLIFDVKKNG